MYTPNFDVPELQIDSLALKEYNRKVNQNDKLERRIVFNLSEYLKSEGWNILAVDDGEDYTEVENTLEAMELIFNLDESRIYFKNNKGDEHWIFMVNGNGEDILSDWSLYGDDKDKFNQVVEGFDVELYF